MSRVDEALRRAGGAAAPAEIVRPVPSRAFEEYPVEDRRTSRALEEPRVVSSASAVREFAPAPIVAPRTVGPHQLTRLAPAVDGKVVIDAETSAASVEEYRRLATALHLMQSQTGIHTLMVSSALPRDGKTLTSTNLCLTLSESYKRRVLLIDADLRRPSVHEVFRVPNSVGLADGLRGEGPISLPYIAVSDYLTILPAGSPDAVPMAGLTSARMRTVITEARSHFDWVVVDTPPVGLISDANILSSLVDGVLLVIGAGSTPYPAVKRAVTEFGRGSHRRGRAQSGQRRHRDRQRLRRLLPEICEGSAAAVKALAVSISRRSLTLIVCETVLIVAAVCLGATIRLGGDAWDLLFVNGDIKKALLIALVCQVSLYYADLYELRVVADRRELFIGVVQALSATSFLLAALYFWFPSLVIGRGVFVVSSSLVLLAVAGWRLVFEWLTRRVAPRERLLLVGNRTGRREPVQGAVPPATGARRRDRRVRRSRSRSRRRTGDQPRCHRHD